MKSLVYKSGKKKYCHNTPVRKVYELSGALNLTSYTFYLRSHMTAAEDMSLKAQKKMEEKYKQGLKHKVLIHY